MSARYGLYQFGRRISRIGFLRKLVPTSLRRSVQSKLGATVMDQFPDRRYMEDAILPAIVAVQPKRLVDVGIEYYTAHYGNFFDESVDRWTLDTNPDVVQFGKPGRHIVGNVLELRKYFEPHSVDVVMMNGPFGYGIDRVDEQIGTLEAALDVMRPGGWLLIGWDRTDTGEPIIVSSKGQRDPNGVKDPLQLEIIQRRFEHVGPHNLPARKVFTDCSHVYDWFRVRQ
ncbi:MAG: class I SAM-dependent methyltransferase [Proteobacteria bacterium]|nr:MAG: class I SAM-dependent methyltransferase [Pseudomonadota bacterium]